MRRRRVVEADANDCRMTKQVMQKHAGVHLVYDQNSPRNLFCPLEPVMNLRRLLSLVSVSFVLLTGMLEPCSGQEVLRIGIVGCDTSHVIAFTKLINAEDAQGALADMKVVAAFPGGSPDIESSIGRVDGYTEQLSQMEIEIVDQLSDLNSRCDVFLLESVDGRVHLEQFKVIAHGKPVFIDKPAAGNLRELLAIQAWGEKTGTPWFTSSALRFCEQVKQLKQASVEPENGKLLSVETSSPYKTESHHPNLYWYGIHGVESLYAVMGPGCEKVSCLDAGHCIATGQWNDGRLGTFRGIPDPTSKAAYRFTLFGSKRILHQEGFSGYDGLVNQIGEFFKTGKPPVEVAETIEMFAFMEAAQESARRNGQAVPLSWALDRAKSQDGGQSQQ